ncbi:MAG: phage tail tip lysozyme [Kofleriaceae bacterium]
MKRTLFLLAQIAFVLTAVTMAGCATDPMDENSDDDLQTSSTEQDLSSNEKAAFQYFVARGLTKKQSAGIVGNLIQESSVRPTAVEFGGGPGRGIAQWSVGGRWNSSHHDNVTWYASQHGISRWSLNTQLRFTWYELKTVGGYGLSAIRKATTVKAATIAFERDFEKCGNCLESKRYEYAKEVYAAFGGAARVDEADEEDPIDVLPEEQDLDETE